MRWLAVALVLTGGCGGGDPDRIVAYGRENNSGTYMYFKEHVLDNRDFGRDVQTLPGTAAVVNAVSRDPNSIGYGGIGYARGIRILAVRKDAASDAVVPTLETVAAGTYPISRYLYFYTIGRPQGVLQEYIEWVLSEEGQKICEAVGYFPLPGERKPAAKPGGGQGRITVKGSDTMVILGQRWAEHYMHRCPGVVVQVTGGGSGTGIAALINGSADLCQSSRPMKDKERAAIREKFNQDAVEIPVALDGLAVYVHESNPLESLTIEQLRRIYTGEVTKWSELGVAIRR